MYYKVSESLSMIGSALKDAAISKEQLKQIVDKIKNAPPEVMKNIGDAVSQGKDASVTAAMGKFGPIVALIIGLAMAAHADPASVGKDLAKADSSTKVEQILDSLINKVDMPTLTMKGESPDMSKINNALNDKAFHFDTHVGPTGQPA